MGRNYQILFQIQKSEEKAYSFETRGGRGRFRGHLQILDQIFSTVKIPPS